MSTKKRVGRGTLPDEAPATDGGPAPVAPLPATIEAIPLEQRAPATHVAQGVSAPKSLVRPEPPFFFTSHPQRWKVLGGRVVPHFNRLVAEGGVNGVGMVMIRGRRVPVVEQAKAAAKMRGEIVLEWDVDGPGTSYIAQDRQTGGWFDRFTSIFPGTDHVEYDAEGYAAWCESLYDRGILPRPPMWVIGQIRSNLTDIRSRTKAGSTNMIVIDQQLAALVEEEKRFVERTQASQPEPAMPEDVQ